MYAANQVVLLSPTDLSKFGFVNGTHYIHFITEKDCASHIKALLDDRTKCKNMTTNMKDLVVSKWYMPDLLKKVIDEGK